MKNILLLISQYFSTHTQKINKQTFQYITSKVISHKTAPAYGTFLLQSQNKIELLPAQFWHISVK